MQLIYPAAHYEPFLCLLQFIVVLILCFSQHNRSLPMLKYRAKPTVERKAQQLALATPCAMVMSTAQGSSNLRGGPRLFLQHLHSKMKIYLRYNSDYTTNILAHNFYYLMIRRTVVKIAAPRILHSSKLASNESAAAPIPATADTDMDSSTLQDWQDAPEPRCQSALSLSLSFSLSHICKHPHPHTHTNTFTVCMFHTPTLSPSSVLPFTSSKHEIYNLFLG